MLMSMGEPHAAVSPTPSVVLPEPAVSKRVAMRHCTSTHAGPCDAVNDVVQVEDWKRRVRYFFRRAFVLRAPFFAADFVFVFRFFAMLPS
jgi:hypothetical protein